MKRLLPLFCAALFAGTLCAQTPGTPGGQAGGDARIKSDMALMAMDGSIPLRFVNALTGEGIPAGQVIVDGLGSFATDGRGIVRLGRVPDGDYRLAFSKQGFITTPVEIRVRLGTVVFNWYSVSPGLEGRAYRFVLDWGERPADLDMHLEKQGSYHISYGNMRTSEDGNVTLDRDDRDGYGPETITVSRAEEGAVYDLYVVDYTNLGRPGSRGLSESGAVVRVYAGDRLIYTFPVPQGAGVRWNVLRIGEGGFQPLNVLAR